MIDFTPINQSFIDLFLGKNIEGKIRFRNFPPFMSYEEIMENWNTSPEYNYTIITDLVLRKKVEKLVENADLSMNFYTNNCQHFTDICKKNIKTTKLNTKLKVYNLSNNTDWIF
jgi:hypothetical protein